MTCRTSSSAWNLQLSTRKVSHLSRDISRKSIIATRYDEIKMYGSLKMPKKMKVYGTLLWTSFNSNLQWRCNIMRMIDDIIKKLCTDPGGGGREDKLGTPPPSPTGNFILKSKIHTLNYENRSRTHPGKTFWFRSWFCHQACSARFSK